MLSSTCGEMFCKCRKKKIEKLLWLFWTWNRNTVIWWLLEQTLPKYTMHHCCVLNIKLCFAYCQTKRLRILKDTYSHTVLPKEYFIQCSVLCFLKIHMYMLQCVIK